MTGGESGIKERVRLIAKRPKTVASALIAVILIAALAAGCTFTGAKSEPEAGTDGPASDNNAGAGITDDVRIIVELGSDIPGAVLDYATQYVRQTVDLWNNGVWTDGTAVMHENKIKLAKISGLTQISTGTAGLNSGEQLWLLEYRLLPEDQEKIVISGGMREEMLDGQRWLTEWSESGQPYLLLHYEYSGDVTVWHGICATTTAEIEWECGTPEMVEQFGSAYTAAAKILYENYLEQAIPITIDYASEELLAQYKGFDEFDLRQDEYAQRILITARGAVSDLSFAELKFSNSDGTFSEGTMLYSQAELSAEHPLVVWVSFPGSVPQRSISFVDETGARRYFAISTSGRDGSLMLIEFTK